jgi:glycosyltransferase involved in cell wall biosynthesis
MYPDDHYVLISHAQQRTFAGLPVAGVVHNGIDTKAFGFEPRSGDYLVFIGDIRADKRPLDAIRLARAAGVPIRIAGPASDYFREAVEPALDGTSAVYVGEVDHDDKVALLKGALASVFFPAFGESCPLVVLESMACGTPVWSVGEGPVPELVEPGVGGLWAADVGGMLALLPEIRQLDRKRVRQYAVERFDVSRMVDDYVAIYERARR